MGVCICQNLTSCSDVNCVSSKLICEDPYPHASLTTLYSSLVEWGGGPVVTVLLRTPAVHCDLDKHLMVSFSAYGPLAFISVALPLPVFQLISIASCLLLCLWLLVPNCSMLISCLCLCSFSTPLCGKQLFPL